MRMKISYYLTLIGLAGLAIVFPWWLNANTEQLGIAWSIASGAVVPLLLLFACLNKTRNWSGITALCMIPYSVIGIMDIVATLGALDSGMLLGVLAILVFFAVLDAGLRAPG